MDIACQGEIRAREVAGVVQEFAAPREYLCTNLYGSTRGRYSFVHENTALMVWWLITWSRHSRDGEAVDSCARTKALADGLVDGVGVANLHTFN